MTDDDDDDEWSMLRVGLGCRVEAKLAHSIK